MIQKQWHLIPSLPQAIAAFGVAAVLLLLNDRFLFESICVPSSSMRPTILRNERIFLQKLGYGDIHRFDVVVIRSRALGERIVKRVIGLPGDRIRLEDSWRVYVNGKSLDYSAPDDQHILREAGNHEIQLVRNPRFFYETKYAKEELLLGPREYFVLGDNRLASGDGRAFGPVNIQEIQGKLTFVWYSYDLPAHRLRRDRVLQKIH